jgi:hypothetical protein
MEFEEDAVSIEKEPSELDELVLDVTGILDDLDVAYAVVSGYVAVLLGRSRATEDVDVITEPFSEASNSSSPPTSTTGPRWRTPSPSG